MEKALRIGLTGGIATGKSTVSSYLVQKGYRVIDADRTAHQLMQAGQAIARAVEETFGRAMLAEDGSVDRKKLGSLIFSDADKRKRLDQISHPLIEQDLIRQAQEGEKEGRKILFFDIPLLMETKGLIAHLALDQVWLVYTSSNLQIKRLMAREGIDQTEARLRISAQMDLDKKKSLADVVIYNQSDVRSLHEEVDLELDRLGSVQRGHKNE